MKSCFYLGSVALLALSAPVAAQETGAANAADAETAVDDTTDDSSNPGIIVTATRSAKAIDKIPGAVAVISTKEVGQQFQVVDDPGATLAATIPGFSPSRQKLSSAGESIRGRNALILLDGIPQGNPLRDGRREGYFLDSELIQRIEVVSGASALYGLGATGGIVNYITKEAEEGTHHQVSVRAASQFKKDNIDWKAGYLLTHKSGGFDVVAYGGYNKRGMLYDAKGNRLGVTPSVGDTMDSHSTNLFLKLGYSFGDQRIEATVNRFRLFGEGDYIPILGNAAANIPTSSQRGTYPAGIVPFNKILTSNLTYSNENVFGGDLLVQLFTHSSDVLFGADTATAFQDRNIAPVGTLYDQGLLFDRKQGGKLTWVRPDAFFTGLEVTLGADQLFDKTYQNMILTDRVWLTPLKYRSTAPFMQIEFDRGPFTIRGGLRYEMGNLKVDDYVTLGYYGRQTNNWQGVPVAGGERSFSKLVKNVGAVWRFADGWSVFAAYSEGFGLPDVGILLRSVTALNQDVDSLVSLKPIVTSSKDVGLNLRKPLGSFGISAYESYSKLGSTLRVGSDGLGQVVCVPTRVRGFEATAELKPVRGLTLYSTLALTDSATAADVGQPLDLELGGRAQGPNKVTGAIDYTFSPGTSVRLQGVHYFDRDINIGRGNALEEHFNGFTTFDLTATLKTSAGTLGFGVENLLNKYYITYYSQSIRTSASDANKQYMAGRGRTASISFTTNF